MTPDLPDIGSRWYICGVKVVVITTAVHRGEFLVIYCSTGSKDPNLAMPLSAWWDIVTSAEKS